MTAVLIATAIEESEFYAHQLRPALMNRLNMVRTERDNGQRKTLMNHTDVRTVLNSYIFSSSSLLEANEVCLTFSK